MFSYFADKQIGTYIGFDCAASLLKRSPSRVQQVVGNIEEVWPFPDESVDIGLCFFVIVHIRDLHHLLSEARRVIKPG
jgi:ubiquinone/menaquinone biosynthesis C-methylase UbiE